jgi:predicted nucleic acid-binding protein
MLRAADAWHSTVAESELAVLFGLLDPSHHRTKATLGELRLVLNHLPAHRTIAPDRDVWTDAGILSGILARLRHIPKPERSSILNDALIFATARKYGHAVLTRNIDDFDLLQQLDPSTAVLFYDI